MRKKDGVQLLATLIKSWLVALGDCGLYQFAA
jgi:hypothetical protein